jgi:1-acyl-sn-glycerol-3-phosphate acyltransferase
LAAATPPLLWGPALAGRLPDALRRRLTAPGVERGWARLARRALRIDLEIAGVEHVDPATPYVVVALHESVVDPLALLHLPIDLRFVLRTEIVGWDYFGPYLATSRHVAVRPEAGAAAYRRMLRTAQEAGSDSIVVFPQGTLLGIETGFHSGAFHLARRLSRPILPVVLTGGHRVWERPFTPVVRLGQRVGMRVLPPVPAARVAAVPPEVIRHDLQAEMKRHALDGSMPAPRRFDPAQDGLWPGYRYTLDPAFADAAGAATA